MCKSCFDLIFQDYLNFGYQNPHLSKREKNHVSRQHLGPNSFCLERDKFNLEKCIPIF